MIEPVKEQSIELFNFEVQTDNLCFCEIKGLKIAIYHQELNCDTISIDLKDYNVVCLSKMKAGTISINARNLIIFDKLKSKNGDVTITTDGKYYQLGNKIRGKKNVYIESYAEVELHLLSKKRKDAIMELFHKGISEQDGTFIGEALTETFNAIYKPITIKSVRTEEMAKRETMKYWELREKLNKNAD